MSGVAKYASKGRDNVDGYDGQENGREKPGPTAAKSGLPREEAKGKGKGRAEKVI